MRRVRIAVTALLVMLVALLSASWASARVSQERLLMRAFEFESDVLAMINRVRGLHHERPLRLANTLELAASAHARAMASLGFFSHTSPDGTSATARIREFYGRGSVAETLFWGFPAPTPEQTVEAWLASASHRRILLMPSLRQVGIIGVDAVNAPGIYAGHNVTIVVADFGTPR